MSFLALRLAGMLAAGLAATSIAIALPEMTPKPTIGAAVCAFVLAAALLSRHAKEVFLAGFILALSYNRHYFDFDDLFGNSGSQGFYWVPADPFLLALLALDAWDVIRGRPTENREPRLAAGAGPVLPFLVACCLSAMLAQRPDWAFNDLFRVVKFAVVMVWLHRNLTPRLWLVAVTAFGISIAVQSILGILQVAMTSPSGILEMAGFGPTEPHVDENRARGTLGHPNYFAPYLLMLIPSALGLALYSRVARTRLLGAGLVLIGLVGTVASESRAPTALLLMALPVVAVFAVRDRAISARTLLGLGVLAVTLLIAAAVPMLDTITHRIQGDLYESVQFRLDLNSAAMAVWSDYPVFGIGLNNATLEIGRHAPVFDVLIADLEKSRDIAHVRAATVHNLYLLFLCETGLIGLAGFLTLQAACLGQAVRASAASDAGMRGLCVGAGCAMLAEWVQQFVDFSLWFDGSWYSLAVIAGLLSAVPTQSPRIA